MKWHLAALEDAVARATRRKRDPSIIRPGDTVIVTVPKFVKRVGYPRCDADYLAQLEEDKEAQHAIDDLLRKLTKRPWRDFYTGGDRHRTRERIERDIAHLMALGDGYGGRERSIHYVERPEFEGCRAKVLSLRTAYTGRYYPPHTSHDYWAGYEYEPGGLSEQKCWRLARVDLDGHLLVSDLDAVELPIQHLKKVTL